MPAAALLVLAVLLAACQPATPQLTYFGVSSVDGVDYGLALTISRRGDRLLGEYFVDAVRGTFAGVVGQELAGELTPSPSCTYSFSGVLTETTLTGTFEPSGCVGGKPGVWDLALR